MTKLNVVAVTLALSFSLAACKKKKEEPKTEPTMGTAAGTGTASEPPKPDPAMGTGAGTGAGTADPGAGTAAGTGAGTAAAAAPATLEAPPDQAPEDCKKMHALLVKLSKCDKVPADVNTSMASAWGPVVKSLKEDWGRANADQKKTISESCANATKTLSMFEKDCK